MVITEPHSTRPDGVKLNRTYSDEGYRIRQVQTDIVYDEAIDIEGAPYTYEETEEAVER